MRKPKETVFHQGGVEFRVEKGVPSPTTRAVIQAALEEKRTLRNRLASLLGRKLKRVDIRDKRGGRKKIGLGRSDYQQGRVVVYAQRIEDAAKTAINVSRDKNWGRRVAADETTRHEIRHLTSGNEESTERYSRRKTKRKQGGHLVD